MPTALLFFTFRVYTRVKVFRRLFWDDALVFIAWLLLLAIAILEKVMKGPMHQMVASSGGELVAPPEFIQQLRSYARGLVVFYWLYFTGLWAIKLSFLLFFRRLGNRVRGQSLIWWTVLALTIASFFTVVAVIDYRCLLGSMDVMLGKYRPIWVWELSSAY